MIQKCLQVLLYSICVKILMLSPFKGLLKVSFNCIQKQVEKPPGNVGVCGETNQNKNTGVNVNYIKP